MGLYGKIDTLLSKGETIATVIVTEIDGSAPQDPGATMLVRSDGSITGTVGGGTVEELSREAALDAIEDGESTIRHWELRPDGNTGMVCGGEMTVFINVLNGDKRLIIAGGGHIALPLSRMAQTMGYDVCVVDDREEYASPERFPNTKVFCGAYDDGIREFGVTENTAVAIATRASKFDRDSAREAITDGAFYVGIVASKTKAQHINEHLLEKDNEIEKTDVEKIRSPAGLDLGGETPEDIALAILSEVTMIHNGGIGEPLFERSGP